MTTPADNDRVEVHLGANGEWLWTRVAGNNRKIGTSGETFSSQDAALTAARRANPDVEPEVADG